MQIFPSASEPHDQRLIGYARVSMADQDPGLQIDALRHAGCRHIYYETGSGGDADREELRRLLRELRECDIVVVWKFDRLSRSARDMLALVKMFRERGAQFRSLTESFDTSGPMGELMFHMLVAFAQFERAMIIERTRAGLARARGEGRLPGRVAAYAEEKIRKATQAIDCGATWEDAMKLVTDADGNQISKSNLQRRVRLLREKDAQSAEA